MNWGDIPRDVVENMKRLREEARELNQGIQTQRKGWEAFQIKVEAFFINRG